MTVAPRLHGYPVSNWFNCARAAMIEKCLGADYVAARASQDEAFLENSAMGKIPWLQTDLGGIGETVAILDYLEEVGGGAPLLPRDAFERARIRQIVNIAQLYVEAPMRALYPCVFMGADAADATVGASFAVTERALGALDRLCEFKPFVRGDALTQADLVLFYTFELANRVAVHLKGTSHFAGRSNFVRWDATIRDRGSTRVVLADFELALAEYLAARGAAFDEASYQTGKLIDA